MEKAKKKNSIICFVLYPNEKGGNLWLKLESPPGSVPEPKIGYGHNIFIQHKYLSMENLFYNGLRHNIKYTWLICT